MAFMRGSRWLHCALSVSGAVVSVGVAVASNQILDDGVLSWPWLPIAVVLALAGSVVGNKIAAQVAALPTGIAEAKTGLAELVRDRWQNEEVMRSLTSPIPVVWHVTQAKVMDHPKRIADGELSFEGRSDDIDWLAGCFRRLRLRRLVITGGAGTGKTTLALQLLLELIRTRTADEPVPVLLQAADWDVEIHPTLESWVAARLRADYALPGARGAGRDTAQALASGGHLLPILDGLDELPEPARAGVVRTLASTLPKTQQLIVTSRTKEYGGAVAGAKRALVAAAVVAPKALKPEHAAEYLSTCLTLPSPSWDEVLTALRSGTAPALANVATTAMGLWLIRAVYLDRDADPAPLIHEYRDDDKVLRAHLLDNLIDALLAAQARVDRHRWTRRSWDPAKAREWTARLARLASEHRTRNMAWWTVVDYASQRTRRKWLLPVTWWVAVWTGLIYGIPAALAAGLAQGTVFGLVFGVAYGFQTVSQIVKSPDPTRLRRVLRRLVFSRARELRRAVLGASIMLPSVAYAWWSRGVWWGLSTAGGFLVMAWFALRSPATAAETGGTGEFDEERLQPFMHAVTPRSLWRQSRAMAGLHLTGGLFAGLVGGLVAEFAIDSAVAADTVRLIGLAGALGILSGMAQRSLRGVWLRTVTTLPHLAPSERLPLRLMSFLDDMHRLGVLRATGPIYQFRHAQMHDHLAENAT